MTNHIIKYIENNNWEAIKTSIKKNQVDWDILVDQINGLIHYLAYQKKNNLIKIIDHDTLKNLILQPNLEENTIGHIAATMNNIPLFEMIIEIEPDVIYRKNKGGYTPLYYLVGDTKLIKKIVKRIDIHDHYLSNEYTFADYYILSKNNSMVIFLLKNIQKNNLTDNSLFTVIQNDDNDKNKISLLKTFIDQNININIMNPMFITPLILATQVNNYPIVKLLLENGADLNYSGPENSHNPLIISIQKLDQAMIELFLSYNINTNIRDKYLKTPLHYLFSDKNKISVKIKKQLLKNTDNINSTDNFMNSILNLLVQNDNWKKYQSILKNHKLKIYLKNRNGIAPINGILDNTDFIELVYQSYMNQLMRGGDWVDPTDRKISALKSDEMTLHKKYIIDKISRGQSYPSKKSPNPILKMIIPPKSNISHFSSYTYNYICFLYYLLEKYPQIKIPIAPKQQLNTNLDDLHKELIQDYTDKNAINAVFRSIIRDYINHSPLLVNHLIIWKNNDMCFFSPYIVQAIIETIEKYPDTEFILLKLSIVSNENFNHANIIIIDLINKTIERFDPYGVVPFIDSDKLDSLLKSFFGDYFPDMKYVSPLELIGDISFQVFSDENSDKNYIENDPIGYCVAWCLWYAELRIKNKHTNSQLLIQKAVYQINKNEEKFKDYIRNYANYLDTEKNYILEKTGIPKKYWYSLHIPAPIYLEYLKRIRKMYDEIM